MIEIYRKGFRLDIPSSQIVTFKKAQNLNGVQNSYSYSNTISVDKTANIKKLLELTDLPIGKLQTLQNGYEVDIVLNGSIQLRNQILKITKETLDKVDLYLLYSDSSIVSKLKSTFINNVVSELKYKKTFSDFVQRAIVNPLPLFPVVYTQTQSDAGKYVIEEMPQLISLQWLVKKMFTDISYTVYGDFVEINSPIEKYFVAPNAGIYQIYGGTGAGFSPYFDSNLTAFDFLNQTLAFFNLYAKVDDTYKTITINSWTNLSNYKSNFKDYSKFFVNYQDFTFQSKLAKINQLTYADSETTFNSFFSNNLSSQDKASYLASAFGSGSTKLFDDSELLEDGTIPLRENGELGEVSAVRIYKVSAETYNLPIYEEGEIRNGAGKKALSVSMRTIYEEFHKAYTDFILTPLIQNIILRYDDILAADFSLTDIFFIEQQAAYWIPLEINFSTKKDQISVKAMLVKKRKVPSPILNNFNSVLLDFKQKVIFPKSFLLTMYPYPVPNAYPWDVLILKSYDQTKNRIYVNEVLIPAVSLPQAFNMSDLNEDSIVIEANQPSDVFADTNTDSLYISAIDTNGGVSNDAYITIKHSGIANLESNFRQNSEYVLALTGFDTARRKVNILEYFVGSRPNLNDTITSAGIVSVNGSTPVNDDFNLIVSNDTYTNVTVKSSAFSIYFNNNFIPPFSGTPRIQYKLILSDGTILQTLKSGSFVGNGNFTQNFSASQKNINNLGIGKKIRIYFEIVFDWQGDDLIAERSADIKINGLEVSISTIKIL